MKSSNEDGRKSMKRNITKTGAIALAALSLAGAANAQMTRVEINGQPLQTSVEPIQMNGRTLVPMRPIFESLGATVQWNPITRGITARRDTTDVGLQIGNRTASINNQVTSLDQPPVLLRGNTFVPLRFVSEALGARVTWNGAQRLVSVETTGGSQVAGYRQISVPGGAVVPVTLDENLSSETARVGQRFMASIVSESPGDSEFPPGTKIEGVVTEATPKTDQNPGVLGIEFRTVIFPDGTRQPLLASLTSLDNDSVIRTSGRITAKADADNGGNDRTKAVIIGAAGGYLVGRLIKRNEIVTGLLGALGGYLYDRNRDKDNAREAILPTGTRLGVRLDRSITYADTFNYADQRAAVVPASVVYPQD
jgi:hypothetical protein